ncbi:MAG: LamG domain-containing protein, partial [Candidatus Microsaccharimonas sp.]
FTYYYNGQANSFCLEATNGDVTYSLNSKDKVVVSDDCTPDGLVMWLRMNGNANDSSGNGYNGTVSAATLTTGQDGQANSAYSFNGISGTSIAVGGLPNLEKSSITVTAWFQTINIGDKKIVSTIPGSHFLQITQSGSSGVMRTCLASAPTSGCTFGTINRSDNIWHFAAAIGDTNGVKVYVDGQSVPEVTLSIGGVGSAGTSIRIGSDGSGIYNFLGKIDDVRIYNRSLATSELQTLYLAGAQ